MSLRKVRRKSSIKPTIFLFKAAAIFNGYLRNGFNFKSQPWSSKENHKKKSYSLYENYKPDLIYVMGYDCQWIKYKRRSPTKEKNKIKKFFLFSIFVFPFALLSCCLSKMFPLFHLHLTLKLNFGCKIFTTFSLPASVRNEIIKLNKSGWKKVKMFANSRAFS